VQVVKPPKLKDNFFNSEDQAKAQSLKQKRNAEKSGIRTNNVEDKIDDLYQPLFPDSEILMVQQNTEQVSNQFFETQNETEIEYEWTTQIYDHEFFTQSYFNDNEFNQVTLQAKSNFKKSIFFCYYIF
jgi:hypothetical protein